ncbi:cellulose synthase regulator protein [Caballeronia ptereochthonis]|uniref:Cyclic di-GMP-binding protein n=1 Tax=Caballeronia ptereochthonis TaxID=1777144 RepID=A0A157ZVY5_9BURK|nr:cellulose synthase regulator protein [Caballeronia ptereochthonis]
MGMGMSKFRVENEAGKRAPCFYERPLGRARIAFMALQIAFAATFATLAAAATGAPGAASESAQQATGVGAVPAPGPAVVYNPAAIAQPALAMPVPAFSGKPDKPLGSRTPTTADPGTLVPGGRRQTLSFFDYGALDPLQLRGTDGQNGIAFSVRGDEVVTAAILHLIYSYSPSLLPSTSQLKLLINGEVAATLPVPREQAGMLVARDVAIDPRFITEFNHLNVQLIGHYTQQCEDPSNSALWATVSNASSLDLTYASIASKPDLAALPQPFFDRRDVRRLQLPFVFAGKPSLGELEAAGMVASYFGSLAGYRGAIFPAQTDNVPLSGNAVVFAVGDAKVAGVDIPPVSGPTIALVERDANARGRLLLVLGRDDNELKIAAKALGVGQNTLSGTSATITQFNDLQPRRPYDAPN